MSVGVLRAFISRHKEEHEAQLSKRTKKSPKVSQNHASKSETPVKVNGSTNGEFEHSEKIPEVELNNEQDKPQEAKARVEFKPPTVLEEDDAWTLSAIPVAVPTSHAIRPYNSPHQFPIPTADELSSIWISPTDKNIVNYALGVLYYMCNATTKEDILKTKVVDTIKRYASAVDVSFSNLAESFLDKHVIEV
ncbi:hypothetical protein L2E82_22080 [Cichorium intybus]|uniref:Uncharacterized protein n=1 Tax=Cichorium intybus TaxID=13427 RepID=A0ACB9DXU8_CICIN|nr:hypothetical protein L2E82_22080 [Cichorium intybus]